MQASETVKIKIQHSRRHFALKVSRSLLLFSYYSINNKLGLGNIFFYFPFSHRSNRCIHFFLTMKVNREEKWRANIIYKIFKTEWKAF